MNILILLVCAIWGSNWVFMKLSGHYFPPVMFSALRFVIASFVLLGIVWYKRTPLPKKQDWKWYAICGLLQTTYPFLAGQIALQYNNASITSVLSFTMPFWLLILGHFILNDRITLPKLIGLMVGFIGLFLVMDINPWHMEWSGNKLLTELLVVTGAMAWAMANVILKKHLQKNDKLQFTTWQMVIGTLGLLFYSLWFEHGESITYNWAALSCLLYAGVISSAGGFLLWSYILSKGDAVKASVSLLLVPVIGSLCSWVFLGETLKPISILGIIFVAVGIGVVNMKWKARSKVIIAEAVEQ
jgi:O-acetylserine/cysteine efflux transporter